MAAVTLTAIYCHCYIQRFFIFQFSDYYGRGFYFDKALNKFYVCFNMHVPT